MMLQDSPKLAVLANAIRKGRPLWDIPLILIKKKKILKNNYISICIAQNKTNLVNFNQAYSYITLYLSDINFSCIILYFFCNSHRNNMYFILLKINRLIKNEQKLYVVLQRKYVTNNLCFKKIMF